MQFHFKTHTHTGPAARVQQLWLHAAGLSPASSVSMRLLAGQLKQALWFLYLLPTFTVLHRCGGTAAGFTYESDLQKSATARLSLIY